MEGKNEEIIKLYKLKELAELEGRAEQTIKNNWRYIKIKLETGSSKAQFTYWTTKKPYWIRYIRLEDLQKALKNKVEFNFITK